jgi:hypothetical protein
MSVMKDVFALIEQKKLAYVKLPFWQFLRDQSIPAQERMAFAPCFAFFVMSFAELNRYVLRETSAVDQVQSIINEHTYEDEDHWIWYLEDLRKLGYDENISFSDAMRFIWSDEMVMQRHVVRWLWQTAATAKPIHRLVLVEAIEATADVFLATTRAVTNELRTSNQIDCCYFGELHSDTDAGHTMHSDEMEDSLANIPFTPEEMEEAIRIVDETFTMFENLMSDLLAHTKVPKVVNGTFLYTYEMKAKQVHKVKPLGHYLVEAGLITHEKLSLALSEQQVTGQRLGAVIAANGWVSEQTIEYMVEKLITPERQTLLQDQRLITSERSTLFQAKKASKQLTAV